VWLSNLGGGSKVGIVEVEGRHDQRGGYGRIHCSGSRIWGKAFVFYPFVYLSFSWWKICCNNFLFIIEVCNLVAHCSVYCSFCSSWASVDRVRIPMRARGVYRVLTPCIVHSPPPSGKGLGPCTGTILGKSCLIKFSRLFILVGNKCFHCKLFKVT
jgi:hypothetical protein